MYREGCDRYHERIKRVGKSTQMCIITYRPWCRAGAVTIREFILERRGVETALRSCRYTHSSNVHFPTHLFSRVLTRELIYCCCLFIQAFYCGVPIHWLSSRHPACQLKEQKPARVIVVVEAPKSAIGICIVIHFLQQPIFTNSHLFLLCRTRPSNYALRF